MPVSVFFRVLKLTFRALGVEKVECECVPLCELFERERVESNVEPAVLLCGVACHRKVKRARRVHCYWEL